MAINILDKAVANRIAAGEVVEKPASIVKELLDNSIDANATEIRVEIKNGGIDLISVSDNGIGIEPDDVKKAFLPHATSKISSIEDLDNISTLGFRGEALASIASVAQVTLISKPQKYEYASKISVNGGEFGSIVATANQDGTMVEVKNLFYNTPARRKFLRRSKSEEADITNIITRYILSHPNIKIKYIADNKAIFDSSGTNLFDAICCVYGIDMAKNILHVEYSQGNIKLDGYIGKVSYTKPNTSYQTLIINGRYVVDEGISKAVYMAYEEFLMSRQFPFFVINLTIPYNEIDVNVHPSKIKVKFTSPNLLFDIFYRAVRQTIYTSINPAKETAFPDENRQNYEFKDINDENTEIKQIDLQIKENVKEEPIIDEKKYEEWLDIDNKEKNKEDEIDIKPVDPIYHNNEYFSKTIRFEKMVPEYNMSIFDNKLSSSEEHPAYQSIQNFSEYKVIGEIFNEFLILEKEDVMLLVDFHAGHERLLYDKFVSQLKNQNIAIQPLLVPYIHKLNVQEMEYILNLVDKLHSLGFDISQFGPTEIRISSIPAVFSDINLKTFVEDLLHDMGNQLPKLDTELDNMLMQKACKSAVKSGMTLTNMQINELLKNFDIKKPVLLCPHGRPIVTVLKLSQIEKWFKRIV